MTSASVESQAVTPLDEVWKLRGCISDLVSLMALPALWSGGDSVQVMGVLSDVLQRMLRPDFIYVRLADGHEMLRTSQEAPARPARGGLQPEDVARALGSWLRPDLSVSTVTINSPLGGQTPVALLRLGADEGGGVLACASTRAGFPTYVETLLLRVAVNQAVTELQRGDLLAARRRSLEAEQERDHWHVETLRLRHELDDDSRWERMVGGSETLRRVRAQAEEAARGGGAVLIQGECGTGKELVARAIHGLSHRKDKGFVRFDCAAAPPGAAETALFGRGPLPGALGPHPGRLELAHGGTLLLQHVDHLPPELQARLQKVLQDRQFERAGSAAPVAIDVRVIATARKDLRDLAAQRAFREDLRQTLSGTLIEIPPLRDRLDDIAPLARHFMQHHARRCGKTVTAVAPATLAALARHSWPGNVRELDNLVQRGVLLSHGPLLELSLGELAPAAAAVLGAGDITLDDAQRQHIMRALTASNWVIAGAAGAAARLGMKRTSLQYRMRKLGIMRPHAR